MAASDLSIYYERAAEVGNRVKQKGREFQILLDGIVSSNNKLKSVWEGQDAMKYAAVVEEKAAEMKKLATTINDMGVFLINVANKYEEASQENAANVTTLY